jgi:hypothetical protein
VLAPVLPGMIMFALHTVCAQDEYLFPRLRRPASPKQ